MDRSRLFRIAYRTLKKEGIHSLLNRTYEYFDIEDTKTELINECAEYVSHRRYQFQKKRYVNPAPPDAPILISPKDIKYSTTRGALIKGVGQISSGDWDLEANCTPISDLDVFQGFLERFRENKSWEETVYFDKFCDKFIGDVGGYSDHTQFKRQHCAYLDRIHSKLSQEGYGTQNKEIILDDITENLAELPFEEKGDILVSIGRDGELLLRSGTYLFSIAKLLELDTIPVKVFMRHKKWQTRDSVQGQTKVFDRI